MSTGVVLLRYFPIVILLLLWVAATNFGWVSTAVLPPLGSVLSSGYEMVTSAEFWDNTGSSLYRGSVGLAIAIIFGGRLASPWRGGGRCAT